MNKEDTITVRYIYGELDPSEELLFEREVRKDENLMIEVESLRETCRRLDNLPHLTPPSFLINNIIEYSESERKKNQDYRNLFYFSIAATFLIVMFSGFFLMSDETENSASDTIHSASAGHTGTMATQQSQQPVTKERNSDSVTPWVDRNDILHVNDFFNKSVQSSSFDSVFRSSMQKLTPVNGSGQMHGVNRNVQLTGSRK
ncbi:MAG: hypothetical protein ACFCU6_05480 [Balneolaceae bacterium]